MPAYVVFTKEETNDEQELEIYSEGVASTFEGHDVAFLAAYGPFEQLEGRAIKGAVILRFSDMQAARNWYYSPAYQMVAQHRFKGAEYRSFIVAGND